MADNSIFLNFPILVKWQQNVCCLLNKNGNRSIYYKKLIFQNDLLLNQPVDRNPLRISCTRYHILYSWSSEERRLHCLLVWCHRCQILKSQASNKQYNSHKTEMKRHASEILENLEEIFFSYWLMDHDYRHHQHHPSAKRLNKATMHVTYLVECIYYSFNACNLFSGVYLL